MNLGVLPNRAFAYKPNIIEAYAVPVGQLPISPIAGLYFSDFFESEFCPRRKMVFATALTYAISRIISGSSNEQMGGIAATSIVAFMANIKTFWNAAYKYGIRDSMRTLGFSIYISSAITVIRKQALPFPALIRMANGWQII